jgi:preprotein translocase subunit YajC
MENLWILAQADTNQAPIRVGSEPLNSSGQGTATVQDANQPPVAPTSRSASPWQQLLPFVIIMVVLYLIMLRGPRKQQREQKQMVQSLKKNDRVRTIGGIFGTVVDVRGDEVVLKIDEANNTKIRISTSAIGKNLSNAEKS